MGCGRGHWQSDAPEGGLFDREHHLLELFACTGSVLALRNGDMPAAAERWRLARQASPDHEPIFDLQPAVMSASAAAGGYLLEIGELAHGFPFRGSVAWAS